MTSLNDRKGRGRGGERLLKGCDLKQCYCGLNLHRARARVYVRGQIERAQAIESCTKRKISTGVHRNARLATLGVQADMPKCTYI